MVTPEDIESLFTNFGIRARHFSIIPDLVKEMEKIPNHSFRDVVTELINLGKIPYNKTSKGSVEVLKYINTFSSQVFLSYLMTAICQIELKFNKPIELLQEEQKV